MTTTKHTHRKHQKRQAIIRLLVVAGILVCINLLAARFHTGLDLTKEKRFTLSPPTKKLLRELREPVVVTVYLKGTFPAGFQRLAEATRERLQSFREYAGSNIVFSFVDPFEGKTEEEKGPIFQELFDKGVIGMQLNVNTAEEGFSQRLVFPYALVQYQGKSRAVRLLENNMGMNSWENLTSSESLLEYKLAAAIHKLELPDRPRLAYLIGHGEPLGYNTFDMLRTLSQEYDIDTFDLVENAFIPNQPAYAAIIINKPTLPFDDKEKFKIDQYLMHGGHALWLIDMLHTPMDSLSSSQQFITTDYGLNLDDQLFKYGVRINLSLVEDLQCNPIPIITSYNNLGQPQMELRKWIYYPVLLPSIHHPIVNNMDAVMTMFANSIDTISGNDIKKTVLLASSKYSRPVPTPVRVSLSTLKYEPDPSLFNKPFQPIAVLLEGRFKSVFQNRLHPNFLKVLNDSMKRPFQPVSDSGTSMIVVADGDILQNDFSSDKGPMEMGYWKYSDARYANKTFMLNCMEYLTDQSGLLEARSKDLRLRLLDGGRVREEETQWQVINILVPISILIIFASCYLFFRKRRYEKPMQPATTAAPKK